MKYTVFISALLFLAGAQAVAQNDIEELPSEVRMVLNSLQGEFNWKIIRPSEEKILRTGSKTSNYELDSLILLSREFFDQSSIKQIGVLGYSPKDSTFFTLGLYNIEIGPNLNRGRFYKNNKTIQFISNDSSRYYLNVDSHEKYYWTYENLIDNAWKKRDMEIIFERKRY